MKKRTKLLTGALTVLAGVLLLSSCTASFCSETDKAHILYAFDYGVSDYYDAEQEGAQLPEGAKPVFEGNTKVYYTVNVPTNNASGIGRANGEAVKAGLQTPSNAYFVKVDQYVLDNALTSYKGGSYNKAEITFGDVVVWLSKVLWRKTLGQLDKDESRSQSYDC